MKPALKLSLLLWCHTVASSRVKRKSTTLKTIIRIGRVLFPEYELHLFIIIRQTTVSIIMRHLKAMQTVIGYRAMLVKVSTPLTKKRDELKKIMMGVPYMPSVNLLQLHYDFSTPAIDVCTTGVFQWDPAGLTLKLSYDHWKVCFTSHGGLHRHASFPGVREGCRLQFHTS